MEQVVRQEVGGLISEPLRIHWVSILIFPLRHKILFAELIVATERVSKLLCNNEKLLGVSKHKGKSKE